MSNQVMKKCSECGKPTLNNSSQTTCTACGTMTGLFGSKRRA